MSDEYCDFCELPLSTCVHGNPPTPPPVAEKAPRATSSRARSDRAPRPATRRTPAAPPPPPPRRRTPPEDFKPWIVAVLGSLGGEAAADDVMELIGERMSESFRPGDSEQGPTGELRWRTACRTARKHLADEGRLVAPRPGTWRLTD